MQKTTFKIQGMHCNSCALLIEERLKNKPGIDRVKVNYDSGKGSVFYNEQKIKESEIHQVVEQAGDYEVEGAEEKIDRRSETTDGDEGIEQSTDSPKKAMILGALIGISVISTVGFFVVLGMNSNEGDSASGTPQVAGDNVAVADPTPVPSPSPSPTPSPTVVDVEVTQDDHIRGDFNAPVTIVEYSDFQCPYCSKFHDTMKQVMANYPNDVRWIYKHFPLDSLHSYARDAAEASECAADQDKFWEYTDELFANQSSITPSYLKQAAKDMGLNTSQFDDCVDSDKYASKVDGDFQGGGNVGVSGTPGNIINGQLVPGALPYDQMQSLIDSILNEE
ncbi:MAG: thioredoxin domain-containing protein [Patescibacteria group bacterium]